MDVSQLPVPSAPAGGFRVYAFRNRQTLLDTVRSPAILVAVNAEKVAMADQRLMQIVNRSIGYADGMGVVLALRRRGFRAARIAGSDLWLAVIHARAGDGRFYVIGSTDDVIGEVVRRLGRLFPGLAIVGYRNGFLSPADVEQLKDALRVSRPDIVLVGMGSPRQELLMEQLVEAWPAVYMGLGGSLDVFVGQRRRAPRWMQRIGLEWAFRFVENPRRLSRLPAYLRFAWLLLRNKV